MENIKILGIVGSPRKNGNTFKLMQKALEAAKRIPGVETEIYEMAGKKFHHCTGCLSCTKTGSCAFKDDLQGLERKYLEADGVILGSPVYHMGITSTMKAMLDRFGNSIICNYLVQGKEIPRFNKVCGVLTIGAERNGGQDLVLSHLVNSSLVMNGVVVAGDTILGSYIGAVGYTGGPSAEHLKSKDCVLNDKEGLEKVANLGKRVAEMTKIMKAGISSVKEDLPSEYFYSREDLI